jgi:dTDP-4-dehydrorhamnose reductase
MGLPPSITLLGGRGMLGTDIARTARSRGCRVDVFDLPEFDITNPDHLAAAVGSSDVVINCAAFTNVDGAESQADLAHRVNAEAVGHLGRLAKSSDVYVLHISTDFVFDGRKNSPYTETDAPSPLSVYGATKHQGEQLLAASGCRHAIIRVQWTYGAAGNNFVAKMLQLAQSRKQLTVVDDQIGSPTATWEVAGTILHLLSADTYPQGLYHFAASGYASRLEQARFIFDLAGLDIDVLPCKTSDFKTPAQRPLNSRFDCAKIKSLLPEPIRKWQDPLKEFMEQI